MEWKNQQNKYDQYVGFVYEIIECDTGKIYIGIKKLFKIFDLRFQIEVPLMLNLMWTW